MGVGTVAGLVLESKAIDERQSAGESKDRYLSSDNDADAESYKSAYEEALVKGILLGVAGVGVLSVTGVFLATKVISVDPTTGGLTFSGTC